MTRPITTFLVAALALLAPALGQENSSTRISKVVFHTTPDQAQVYMDVSGQHTYEKFLGNSGAPLLLDLSQLKGVSGFDIVIRREGYFDKRERIGIGYFNDRTHYPEQGTIRLEPQNWMVPARAFLAAHTTQLGIGVVLCLSLASLLVLRRRQTAHALHRASLLEAFEVRAGQQDANILARLDRWRLIKRLGHGGSGAVYKAVPDGTLDEAEAVAVKLFSEESADSPEFLDRFRREARLCRDLQHPGIVRLLDWGDQDGIFYLVMEFVDGQSLRAAIPNRGMPVDDALEHLLKIAQALEHAHSRGIIHRDIKPENILLNSRGQIKLTDFGLAREVLSSLTKTGRALGTPGYMSPEQIQGDEVDQRCDQYSLGIVAYELLTGARPFLSSEKDPAAVMFQQVHQEPLPIAHHSPGMPPEIETLISRMLSRVPEKRFSNMASLVEAVRSIQKQRASDV